MAGVQLEPPPLKTPLMAPSDTSSSMMLLAMLLPLDSPSSCSLLSKAGMLTGVVAPRSAPLICNIQYTVHSACPAAGLHIAAWLLSLQQATHSFCLCLLQCNLHVSLLAQTARLGRLRRTYKHVQAADLVQHAVASLLAIQEDNIHCDRDICKCVVCCDWPCLASN